MKPKLKRIRDQVVVLEGATSGIGLETALYMAEKGAKIVIVGRSQDGLDDALNQVRIHAQASRAMQEGDEEGHAHNGHGESGTAVAETTDQVIALEGDVTNFDQIKSVADQVIQRFGRIDTWVNVAGVTEYALFEDTSADEFRRIIEVNLLGEAYGAMAVLPYLKQQDGGGALIFVSSVAGRVPIPFQSAYNASKHGIMGLVETLRQELKHTGAPVSVTAILPSSVNTPLFEKSRTKVGVEPKPIPPIYDVKMVARAITYAAQHEVRELIVGDSGYMVTFMRRLAPTLTNNYMGRTGFRKQRTDEQKSAQAPDNLYHHVEGYDVVQGEFTPQTQRFSIFTWFATHPTARMILYGSLIAGTGALVGWQIVKGRSKRQSWRYRLPKQAKHLSKQLNKRTNKAIKRAGEAIQMASEAGQSVPSVITNLPFVRKRTFFEKAMDTLEGWWEDALDFLPFTQRSSMFGQASDWMPDINISNPFNRQKSITERVTDRIPDINMPAMPSSKKMSKKVRKDISKRLNSINKDKLLDQISMTEKRQKAARDFYKKSSKLAERADEQRKKAMEKIAERVPSKKDLQKMTQKEPEVVRKQTLVEKMPFGERRETIVERVPYKK